MSNSAVFLGGSSSSVAAAGALGGDGSIGNPLQVEVDGATITIVGNELVAASSGSILHQATKALTNAQIKALPTTAVQLLAAQGANTIIVPSLVWWYARNWAVDYDNIGDNSRIGLEYGATLASTMATFSVNDVFNLLADSASHPAMMATNIRVQASLAVSSRGQFQDDPDTINAAMNIYAVNGGSHTGNFTAGDDAQDLVVSMIYTVFNTQTGVFV